MKSDKEYLFHIRDEILFIETTVKDIDFSAFYGSLLIKHAIERSLEIIGEASKKLSSEFKTQYPSIEWRAVAGTRDKLIHEYMGVDYELVWDILNTNIPELKIVIEKAILDY